MSKLPPFEANHLEAISRVLGDAASGTEITRLLSQCGIHDQLGEGITKWRRLLTALQSRQTKDYCANNVAAFIQAVMAPVRFESNTKFELHRAELNAKIAFCGLELGPNGKLQKVEKAETIPEAEKRAKTLRAKLQQRHVHPDVLEFCKAELLQDNYFHAVFEATKSVAHKIRSKTGIISDGAQLVEEAFSIKNPHLAFNTLETESEQSEHKGFANLLKGFFGAVRNPLAHEPKIMWEGEEDAVDYLTLASLLHRKLDNAIVVRK